ERVPIPDELIPADARVEMDAKVAAGYFSTIAPASAMICAQWLRTDLALSSASVLALIRPAPCPWAAQARSR
ncbi:MAG: hypothetical protein EOO78_16165, partial [Oxalobacteraceae bacterium]